MKKIFCAVFVALITFSACKKDEDKTKPVDVANNTWQFTADGHIYKGSIIYTDFGAGNMMLTGNFEGRMDTVFGLSVQFAGNKVETGTFVTETKYTLFSLTKLANNEIIYAANATLTPPVLTIKVSTYDSTTKVVSGTFFGNAYKSNKEIIPLTNGVFKATLE